VALWDEVVARVPNERLVQLTRAGDTSATTVDAAKGTKAAADAQARFEATCGITFDVTNPLHVEPCIAGVLYYLHSYRDLLGADTREMRQVFEDALDRTRRVLGRDRPTPYTTSALTPSREVPTGATVRPVFDTSRFDALTIGRRVNVGDD